MSSPAAGAGPGPGQENDATPASSIVGDVEITPQVSPSPLPDESNGNDSATTSSATNIVARSAADANNAIVAEDDEVVDMTKESAAPVFAELDKQSAEEWAAVKVTKFIGASNVYDHIYEVKLCADVDQALVESSKALQRIKSGEYWCCMLCKEQNKSLYNCLRKMKAGQTTNQGGRGKHLQSVHRDRLAELKKQEEDRKRKKEGNQDASQESTGAKKKQKTMSGWATITSKPKPKLNKSVSKEKVVSDELHKRIGQFVTCGSHPDTVVSDPNFRGVLDYSIKNARYLQNYKHMGYRKLVTVQCDTFDQFITSTSNLISEIRSWYVTNTGEEQPFISAAHDVWDGKRKQINGLTIFFLNPASGEMFRIPIALTPPLGKSSVELRNTSLLGLERVGIKITDLYRSVNDNTSSAELEQQCKRKGTGRSEIDWKKVADGDIMYISSKFDSIEWWINVGSEKCPLIFPVAPAIIAQPASNGFQERIFSACTWFDDPLRQSLKNQRFEMAVLLAVNDAFNLEEAIPSDEAAKAIVERVISTFEKSGDDLGLDANADGFIFEKEDE